MTPVHIENHDRHLGFEIADTSSFNANLVIHTPRGLTVTYHGSLVVKTVCVPKVLQFLVDASITVDLALFPTWLYKKVKNKGITIIRRVVTDVTRQAIR